MVRERYITENPFRLVGAGSGLSQQQLRRKADGAVRSAAVGLRTAPPFETEFGAEDVDGLSTAVRALATDSILRTVFRIMWPLSGQAIPYLLNPETTLTESLSPEELAQLVFLSAWYSFLRDGAALAASEALNCWSDLYNDSLMTDRLKTFIMEEDGVSEGDASKRLVESQQQVAQYLLRRTASGAAQEWEAGNPRGAAAIIEALLESPSDETMQLAALDPVVEIGQSLAEKVEKLTSDIPEYERGAPTDAPREVVQLERLSSILSDRHPIARGWVDAVDGWYTTFGCKMRVAALKLNEHDDNEGALAVVETALTTVRDAEVRNRLLEDEAALRKILADREQYRAYAEIEPISSAPSLRTVNGIGTTLYGSAPFPPDKRLRYSTLYFVLLGIPVFPLNRYVVEPMGNSQWKFFGTTKWTKGMNVHVAVSCVLILLGVIASWHSSETSTMVDTSDQNSATSGETAQPSLNSPGQSYSSTSSNSSWPSLTSPIQSNSTLTARPTEKPLAQVPSTADTIAQRRQEEHRRRLQKRLDALKATIESAKSRLDSDDRSIEAERTTLESAKARIDSTSPNRESQQEIDDYNARVTSYETQRADFNAHVERYNSKLGDLRKLVKRHNDIVVELNKDR